MVSCLTVTREDRLAALERSIECFARQTLADRELVIVHDGSRAFDERLRQLTGERWAGQRIAVHRAQAGLPLGALRNVSLERAGYGVVCQWDDDDLNHPLRLERQLECLSRSGADFCFFTDQLHWFVQLGELYWDDWNVEPYPMNLIQGTLMGYRDRMGAYPPEPRGEDTHMLLELARNGRRLEALSEAGYLNIYVYHGRNTWAYPHHAAIASWKRYRRDRLMVRKSELERHLGGYAFEHELLRLPFEGGWLEYRPRGAPGERLRCVEGAGSDSGGAR
jgi:glycosyltransferase involved in cell wall biosynthesis